MKTIEIDIIEKTDNLDLRIAVFFWKEYNPNTVLIAYAELVKRGYPISKSLFEKMTEFRENQLLSNS
ncbi:MAG: hypothetical protein JHC39_04955 [Lentimicrobium sp.]|jgi:hypothetical protein|nr:hypothetical protein [Lentimicrobium sp.]